METDTESEIETKRKLEEMFGTPFQECPCTKCSEEQGRSDCKCEEFEKWYKRINWDNLEKKVLGLGGDTPR